MNKLTGKGLTEYVLDIYNNKKTIYMAGGAMSPVSQSYINSLAKAYPEHYPKARQKILAAALSMDYFGTDGAGLIKSYYWGGIGSPRYNAAEDFNAEELYTAAKIKGAARDLPECSGIILYNEKEKSAGIYIGSGTVIESAPDGRGDGVCKSRFHETSWDFWFECLFFDYSDLAVLVYPSSLPPMNLSRVS